MAAVDLRGRTALVTGASGGLGLETARALAAAGAAVTLTARDEARGAAACEQVVARHPEAKVALEQVELVEPTSVRALAERWAASAAPLDLLVCNAGIMACPLQRTPEGWELQFATNHLGHFLLTSLLLDALRASGGARVVVVSSAGHALSPVVFDDIHFERRPYDPWSAYGQSKTANALFALELDRRLAPDGAHAFAVHPGMVATDLARHVTRESLKTMIKRGDSFVEPVKPVEDGAATALMAATDPALVAHGGAYLADCRVAPVGEGTSAVAPHACDPDAARRLWGVSEELLGLS